MLLEHGYQINDHQVSLTNEICIISQKLKDTMDTQRKVAHDIRSPVSILNTIIEHLVSIPTEQKQLLDMALHRINEIVNELVQKNLNAKTNLQNIELHKLGTALDELVCEKSFAVQNSGIKIRLHNLLDDSLLHKTTRLNLPELKRVISNIINNAVEALGDAGIVDVRLGVGEMSHRDSDPLRFGKEKTESQNLGGSVAQSSSPHAERAMNCATPSSQITESLNLGGSESHIHITITDNGTGIPAEILPRLMQEGATFGKDGGNGLGLYLAKKTLEAWGGTIGIESKINVGTTVSILLNI